MFEAQRWNLVPFHFWSVALFVLGCMVGSFLNVCVYRMPRGESLMRPGSHCPNCQTPIPLRLNVPLISWLWLRGRCRFCGAAISPRYFLIELLTGLLFLGCWLRYGADSPWLALVNCLLMAGLTAAAFIDLEHFIIPDAITLGGIAAGFVSSFLVPELHRAESSAQALQRCLFGAILGGGVILSIVQIGKFFLGRHRLKLDGEQRIYFDEECLILPDQRIPYGEILFRQSDAIRLHARQIELPDRCYWDAPVRMTKTTLCVGAHEFKTEDIAGFQVLTAELVLPREAMGLGDVKFMAAIGAFTGWAGILFSLLVSALVGSIVGLTLIALGRHNRQNPIAYGPYIALAAAVWVFAGESILTWWLRR